MEKRRGRCKWVYCEMCCMSWRIGVVLDVFHSDRAWSLDFITWKNDQVLRFKPKL
jgi:hypothetical protein